MRLIYFSAVPWASFRQRPQEFAEWAHRRLGAQVLWVEPYPVRLPAWQDLSRPHERVAQHEPSPPWLEVLAPRALPLEPLRAGRALNDALSWPRVLARLQAFASGDADTTIVVGKPSHLAWRAIGHLGARAYYDAMDDFPAFHKGMARRANEAIESAIARRAAACFASATSLVERLGRLNARVLHVPNGLAAERMPLAREAAPDAALGYVGTLGPWFDWAWLAELANALPARRFEIHGPVYRAPDVALPANVKLLPALAHAAALQAMSQFAAGLVPFLRNELTASVDPVKYYEYRALGLPVIGTPFGEMVQRSGEPRVLLTERPAAEAGRIAALAGSRDAAESVARFRAEHAWHARFEPLATVLADPPIRQPAPR